MAALREIKVSPKIYELLESFAKPRGESVEQFVEFLVNGFDKELAASRERAFIGRLREEGLLVSTPTASPSTPRNFKPVPIEGEPLSQTIIKDRE